MLSPSLQSLVAQAHIEELQRVAQTYNRDRAFAAATHEDNRPKATHLSAGVKQAIRRILGGGRRTTETSAAIHGLELVAHSSAPGPRP